MSREEVIQSLHNVKNGKAHGVDGIPSECFRNHHAITFMHALFNKCFSSVVYQING